MTLSKITKLALCMALMCVLAVGFAYATTQTATFPVSTTIAATCTISTTPLSFGTYSGLALASTASVTTTCTNGTHFEVGLNAGTATGATTSNRSMTGPSSTLLSYGLYFDAAHTNNWGNIVDTDTYEGTGSGLSQTLTVYGLVPAAQYYAPGLYSDTITATVTY